MMEVALKMRTKKMAISKLLLSLFILKKKNFPLSKLKFNSKCQRQTL